MIASQNHIVFFLLKFLNTKLFFTSCRGGRRQDQTGSTLPAWWFRPHASYLRKEARCRAAAKKLLSLRLSRNRTKKGCDPFDIPGVLISNCYPVERFYGFRQHSRSGLQLQTSLQLVQRSTCRAANMAVPTAARHFCSAKILAPSRVSQVCRTPDQQPLKSTNQCPTGNLPAPGSPRVPEGPRSLCLGKSPEKPFPRVFFWATSSRRLDTALLCAAKKRGVKKNQLAGLCQTP